MKLVQSKKNLLKYKIVDRSIKMGWILFENDSFKVKLNDNCIITSWCFYELYLLTKSIEDNHDK